MDTQLTTRLAVRETMGVIFMGVSPFWPADEVAWWPAWALIPEKGAPPSGTDGY